MSRLRLSIGLESRDRATGPLRQVRRAAGQVGSATRDAAAHLRTLETSSRDLDAFRRLKTQARNNAGELAQLDHRIEAAARTTTELGRRTRGSGREFERARRNLARLRQQKDRATQAARRNAAAQEELREKLRGAGVDTRRMASEQRRLRSDIASATDAANRQAEAMARMERRTEALAEGRRRMDRMILRAGGLALSGQAGLRAGQGLLRQGQMLAQEGLDYGAEMARVGALARVDRGSEAFRQLDEAARAAGRSTMFTAAEAAQAQRFLVMAGFNVEQTLAALPTTLHLAQAGSLDLASAADIASNILSGFRLEADEMGRVGDVLAATFTRSNVDLTMLGDTMRYMGPLSAELGMSLEEASAMAGLLGNAGIQGSQAGTALRALQSRLASLPAPAAEAMEHLGIVTTDAEGNLRPVVEILGDIARATEDLGSAERLSLFTDIAGQEAGAALAQLVSQEGAEGITQFAAIVRASQGELAEMAGAMGDTAAGDIRTFQSAWADLQIELFQGNSSPLRELIQGATGMVRAVREWAAANPELTATLIRVVAIGAGLLTVLGGLATGVAAVLGPFAMLRFALASVGIRAGGMGGMLRGGGRALRGLATIARLAFPLVVTGIRAIGLALMANPIGAIIGGIALAATLIIAYWDEIGPFFGDLWQGVRAVFGRAWRGITRTLGFDPLARLSGLWSDVRGFFGRCLDAIPGLVRRVWARIREALGFDPMGLITEAWGGVVAWFSAMWDDIEGRFRRAVEWIQRQLAPVIDTLGWVSEQVDAVFGGEGYAGNQAGRNGLSRLNRPADTDETETADAPSGDSSAGEGRGRGRNGLSRLAQVDPPAITAPETERLVVVETAPAEAAAAEASRHTTVDSHDTYSITVNAPPGLSAEDVARLVRRELDAHTAAARSRDRSALFDGVR